MNFWIEVLCKTLSDKCELSSGRLSEIRTYLYLGVCFPNLLTDLREIRHRRPEYNHVWRLWILLKYVQWKALFFTYGHKCNCAGICYIVCPVSKVFDKRHTQTSLQFRSVHCLIPFVKGYLMEVGSTITYLPPSSTLSTFSIFALTPCLVMY